MSAQTEVKRLLGALGILTLCQCAGPVRVSPEEFKQKYALIPMAQTMHNVEYLGQRDGAAYINHQSMSLFTGNFENRVIYTPLEEFDPAFRTSLPLEGFTTMDLALAEQKKAARKHPSTKRSKKPIDRNNIDAILNDPGRRTYPSPQTSNRDFIGGLGVEGVDKP